MTYFLQNCLDGIMVGSSYSLLALSFTIVFGVMRRVNFAFGPSIMLGAYLGTWLHIFLEAAPWVVALVTILGTAFISIYVERLCFWAIRREVALASVISSFAIWMQLEELALILLPERTYPFPKLFLTGAAEFGPFLIRYEYLVTLGATILILTGLAFLIYRSRFGLALRALSENPTAAQYMGININMIRFWTFVIVSIIGGIAGYLLLATDQQITPHFGLWATIKGLIAMMLGGMGSIIGALIGGMLLGVIETQTQWYLGNEYRDVSVYFALFAMLVIRPGGIFGNKIVSKTDMAFQRV